MMVPNGNRDTNMDAGWDDAIPYGKAFIQAAPNRTIWGTDWSHPQWKKRMMNDTEEVELLYRYAEGDMPLPSGKSLNQQLPPVRPMAGGPSPRQTGTSQTVMTQET